MKKFVSLVIALFAVVLLTGCGSNPESIDKYMEKVDTKGNYTLVTTVESSSTTTEYTKTKTHTISGSTETYTELKDGMYRSYYQEDGVWYYTEEATSNTEEEDAYASYSSYVKGEDYTYNKDKKCFVNNDFEGATIVLAGGKLTLTVKITVLVVSSTTTLEFSKVGSTTVSLPKATKAEK